MGDVEIKPIKSMRIANYDGIEERYIGADSEDISVYVDANGNIVSRDESYITETSLNNILQNGQEHIQYTEMPTPSAVLAGKVYQYVGVTDSNFTTGSFYQCIEQTSTGNYIWKATSSSVAFSQVSGGENGVLNKAVSAGALFNTIKEKFDADYSTGGNVVVDVAHGGTGTDDGTINGVKLGIENDVYGYYDTNGNFKSFRQPTGDAVPATVLSGYTFANASNDTLIGEMVNYTNNTQTVTPTGGTGNQTLVLPNGYHNSIIVNRTAPYNQGITDAQNITWTANIRIYIGPRDGSSGMGQYQTRIDLTNVKTIVLTRSTGSYSVDVYFLNSSLVTVGTNYLDGTKTFGDGGTAFPSGTKYMVIYNKGINGITYNATVTYQAKVLR